MAIKRGGGLKGRAIKNLAIWDILALYSLLGLRAKIKLHIHILKSFWPMSFGYKAVEIPRHKSPEYFLYSNF